MSSEWIELSAEWRDYTLAITQAKGLARLMVDGNHLTEREQELLDEGLRILARMIARAHLKSQGRINGDGSCSDDRTPPPDEHDAKATER